MYGLGAIATVAVLVAFRSDILTGAIAAVVTATSTSLSVIDFNEHRLPNRITLPLAGFATAAVVVLGVAEDDLARTARSVGIAIAVFLVVAVLGLAGGIGMGDVKFSYPLAAILAWFGSTSMRVAVIVMILVAGVYTAVTLIRNRSSKMMIPFGPFMAAGFVAGVLAAA